MNAGDLPAIRSSHADGSRIIVALDFADAARALAFVDRIEPGSCRMKIGKELFTAAGPRVVAEVRKRGFDVFLDLKFHDIPSTVANACSAAMQLGVWMVNVHALGGREMLSAARRAVPPGTVRLIAVTLLTSLGRDDLTEVGLDGDPQGVVERLARMVKDCGLDGVVCSAREAPGLRRALARDFCLVTPGVRPAGTAPDEQKRVVTPREAIANGADYLVIGRPITQAADPGSVLQQINDDIAGVVG
ncbi:orotidine-5'-phosphate decarboxylase [Nitrosovibrio sp. Nv17]|uniref:orotidine-5'-phosphate decarboxylase n=1 Tax=Nitrosovibrio sp. Nv17 TaxID=1855339 RepID=UPI0015A5BDF5|nr:orotidine-5'-phosphate decarboxylase [Nitrosovibrio sp. Nv17]